MLLRIVLLLVDVGEVCDRLWALAAARRGLLVQIGQHLLSAIA